MQAGLYRHAQEFTRGAGGKAETRPDKMRGGGAEVWAVVRCCCPGGPGRDSRGTEAATAAKDDLPDAPSAQMSQSAGAENSSQVSPPDGSADGMSKTAPMRPCKDSDYTLDKMPLQGPPPCIPENPIQPFVTSVHIQPLTSEQKGVLAIRDFLDPFNFITIAGYSAIATAVDPHSPYGPGFQGLRQADRVWATAGCAGRVFPDVCDSFVGAPGPALSPDADREL